MWDIYLWSNQHVPKALRFSHPGSGFRLKVPNFPKFAALLYLKSTPKCLPLSPSHCIDLGEQNTQCPSCTWSPPAGPHWTPQLSRGCSMGAHRRLAAAPDGGSSQHFSSAAGTRPATLLYSRCLSFLPTFLPSFLPPSLTDWSRLQVFMRRMHSPSQPCTPAAGEKEPFCSAETPPT